MEDRMPGRFIEEFLTNVSTKEDRAINIFDKNMMILASTERTRPVQRLTQLSESDFAKREILVRKGATYQKVACDEKNIFYVSVEGSDEKALSICNAVEALMMTIIVHEGRDVFKVNFFRRLINEGDTLENVDFEAWRLNIDPGIERMVVIMESPKTGIRKMIDLVRNNAANYGDEIIFFPINETSACLVFHIENVNGIKRVKDIIHELCDLMEKAGLPGVCAGIGSAVRKLSDIPASYRDAQFALECRKIYKLTENIIESEELKIEKALRCLPEEFCRKFIGDVKFDNIDDDTFDKIKQFFKCNFNVMETSRTLFVHRNTLIYKLDKIKSETGLDLKNFEQAVTFKLAFMMKQYLEYKKTSISNFQNKAEDEDNKN